MVGGRFGQAERRMSPQKKRFKTNNVNIARAVIGDVCCPAALFATATAGAGNCATGTVKGATTGAGNCATGTATGVTTGVGAGTVGAFPADGDSDGMSL